MHTHEVPECPECGRTLSETFNQSGVTHWYCAAAIGQAEWDKRFMTHVLPEGDPHKRVMAWTNEMLERRGTVWVAVETDSRALDYNAQRRERTKAA